MDISIHVLTISTLPSVNICISIHV